MSRAINAAGEWPTLLAGFAAALVLTFVPITLHISSQPVAILFCVLGAFLASRFMESAIPLIVIIPNIFQNTAAALVSSYVDDYTDIEILKSYSFVTTMSCWLYMAIVFLRQPSAYSPFVRRLIYGASALLAVVGVYFVIGLTINPRNATVYLRNIGLPILMFQLFVLVGAKNQTNLPRILTLILVVVAACGYCELLAPDLWLSLTNGWRYLTLFTAKRLGDVEAIRRAAEQGLVVTSALDFTKSDLFNTPYLSWLQLKVQRLQGPGFNTISFGYLMSSIIALLAIHGRVGLALIGFPLMLATSAKGPLVFTILCVAFTLGSRRAKTNLPVFALALFLCVYAVAVFQIGYNIGDFHVLGLIGGMMGFLRRPLGHSLAEGGNLSILDFSTLKWENFQREGATDVAVESAFGVLWFQLGVAAVAWFGFYFWVAALSWRLFKDTHAPALAFITSAIMVAVVNGLYQEEAYFVPFSLAFLMAYCGLILGATDRAVLARLLQKTPADDQSPNKASMTPRSRRPSSFTSPKLVE